MKKEHHQYIDTIIMSSKVRLGKGGGALFARATPSNIKDHKNVAYTLPIINSYKAHDTITPEIVYTRQFDGRVQVHTSKDFESEYGYGLFLQLPPWIYQQNNSAINQSKKQIDAVYRTPIYLQVKIPSFTGLIGNIAFNDWLVTKADLYTDKMSDCVWDYILDHTPLHKYGLEAFDNKDEISMPSFKIKQLDLYKDISGRYVKDILELVSVSGYYARKDMRIWNNSAMDTDGTATTFQSPNGIEFRKGKKSSEIYKFYDKELRLGSVYYDGVYTSAGTNRTIADNLLKSVSKGANAILRYEVSLRRVASQRDAIAVKYGKVVGELGPIKITDVLDTDIYSRVPQQILKDGLFSIFGGEIVKQMSELPIGEKTMTDTDILQKYTTKGLKYLGVKYLMDKGMSNDQIWKYMVKRGGMSYEVVRRLRNEMSSEGLMTKMNDSHNATMDILRREYNGLK